MKRFVVLAVLAVALLPLLMSACSSVKIGYVGNNIGSRINGTYRYFNGTETKTISAKAGQTITIQYSSTVEAGGLSMTVFDPDGNVTETLSANTTGTEELQATADEKYQLVIEGDRTRGSFSVSWNVK